MLPWLLWKCYSQHMVKPRVLYLNNYKYYIYALKMFLSQIQNSSKKLYSKERKMCMLIVQHSLN